MFGIQDTHRSFREAPTRGNGDLNRERRGGQKTETGGPTWGKCGKGRVPEACRAREEDLVRERGTGRSIDAPSKGIK